MSEKLMDAQMEMDAPTDAPTDAPMHEHQPIANDTDITMGQLEEDTEILILSDVCSHGVDEVYSPPRVVPISFKH